MSSNSEQAETPVDADDGSGACPCGCELHDASHVKLPEGWRRGSGSGIELIDVTIRRGGNTVVDGVTAAIPCGAVTALVGPNGAGKTTLLDAILGFARYEGKIVFRDRLGHPRRERPRVGYVPQRFAFDRELPMTPVELVAAGQQRLPLWFGARKTERARAETLLGAVGAERVAHRRLGTLSGGELQRVLLAAALRREPELLILDEPGAGVDAAGEDLFCEVLEHLRRQFCFTQLMVSHNLALVVSHAEQAILINRKLVAAGPPQTALSPETLQTAYGVHMGVIQAKAPRNRPTG